MKHRPRGHRRVLVGIVAIALAATACTASVEESVADAAPTPSASPSPSPTPPPDPVVGTVEVTTTDTSHNERLGLDEDGDPAPGSVDAAATAVAASLDAWLDGAQADSPDLAVLGAAWLPAADPAAASVLRSGITTGENPVTAANYLLDVHLEPDPTVVAADVTVDRLDGTTVRVEFLLDVTGATPALLLVGTNDTVEAG